MKVFFKDIAKTFLYGLIIVPFFIVPFCFLTAFYTSKLVIAEFKTDHSILVIHQDDAEHVRKEQQAKIKGCKK